MASSSSNVDELTDFLSFQIDLDTTRLGFVPSCNMTADRKILQTQIKQRADQGESLQEIVESLRKKKCSSREEKLFFENDLYVVLLKKWNDEGVQHFKAISQQEPSTWQGYLTWDQLVLLAYKTQTRVPLSLFVRFRKEAAEIIKSETSPPSAIAAAIMLLTGCHTTEIPLMRHCPISQQIVHNQGKKKQGTLEKRTVQISQLAEVDLTLQQILNAADQLKNYSDLKADPSRLPLSSMISEIKPNHLRKLYLAFELHQSLKPTLRAEYEKRLFTPHKIIFLLRLAIDLIGHRPDAPGAFVTILMYFFYFVIVDEQKEVSKPEIKVDKGYLRTVEANIATLKLKMDQVQFPRSWFNSQDQESSGPAIHGGPDDLSPFPRLLGATPTVTKSPPRPTPTIEHE